MFRKFKLTIILSLFSANAFAVPKVLREEPRVQKAGLFVYLENQCELHLRTLDSSVSAPAVTAKCLKAASNFIQSLDLATRDNVSRAVVFQQDILKLAAEKKTSVILKAMKDNADLLKLGIQEESLYELIKRLTGSSAETIRFIATLFQDTTGDMYHVEWLMKRSEFQNDNTVRKNAELVKSFIDRINGAHGRKIKRSFFPASVTPPEDNNFYHLFVIARLAHLMRNLGNERATSFLLPFTMNYAYEILDVPAKGMDLVRSDVALTKQGAREDIYLGYIGALWGSGVSKVEVKREEFHDIFRDNTRSGSNYRELLRKTNLN